MSPRYPEPVRIQAAGLAAIAYAGMAFGIWWMRRIYRAPLEEDAQVGWRYRDR